MKKDIKIDGFFTEEVRENRIRIGFDITSLQGQKISLARIWYCYYYFFYYNLNIN